MPFMSRPLKTLRDLPRLTVTVWAAFLDRSNRRSIHAGKTSAVSRSSSVSGFGETLGDDFRKFFADDALFDRGFEDRPDGFEEPLGIAEMIGNSV